MKLYDHAKKIFTQEHLMLKAQQSMVGQHRQLGEQKVCSNSKENYSSTLLCGSF